MTPQPPKTSQGRREPFMEEDDLVDPPDPAVWEGAMRCDICGYIEVHAHHAAASHPAPEGLSAREAAEARELAAFHEPVLISQDLLRALLHATTLPESFHCSGCDGHDIDGVNHD